MAFDFCFESRWYDSANKYTIRGFFSSTWFKYSLKHFTACFYRPSSKRMHLFCSPSMLTIWRSGFDFRSFRFGFFLIRFKISESSAVLLLWMKILNYNVYEKEYSKNAIGPYFLFTKISCNISIMVTILIMSVYCYQLLSLSLELSGIPWLCFAKKVNSFDIRISNFLFSGSNLVSSSWCKAICILISASIFGIAVLYLFRHRSRHLEFFSFRFPICLLSYLHFQCLYHGFSLSFLFRWLTKEARF